ncbi:glutathione S-transferase 1-like [Manduca sexta]|uniref:glutathione S-transferase 1-like n=1 Tax=Manduca sexta TaxID=7130 RepID=UPI00188E272F|nr:glutathione S-transferase 1-like [Manduca sexta]
MPIVLYKTNVSPPARATLMIIDILGIKVETKEVNLPGREHYTPEYLEKNPLHTVPLLEDDDLTLADSHAIITYLVSKYGGDEHEKLYPKELKARAIVDQRLYFDATVLFQRLISVIYGVVKRNQKLSDQQIADIIEGYDILEKYLSKTAYVAGDDVTVADVSCVATLSSLNSIVPVDKKYIKIHNWWGQLQNEEWYQKINVPGMKLLDGFIKQFL